ncbi:MAG: hypothetical protein ACJAY8_000366, partial [Sphingobacteriales bacterium]
GETEGGKRIAGFHRTALFITNVKVIKLKQDHFLSVEFLS